MWHTLRMLDYVILHILWICHIIYNALISIRRKDDKQEENKDVSTITESTQTSEKRHFVRLYTTSSVSGRPICYMDVYEIFSPKDEQRLRDASSRGIPNTTYLKYNQHKVIENENKSQTWLEYYTLAL